MDAIGGVMAAKQAQTSTQISTAVTAKIMNSQADLAEDMMNKLFASMGIGANLNVKG